MRQMHSLRGIAEVKGFHPRTLLPSWMLLQRRVCGKKPSIFSTLKEESRIRR
uniref:Uncharacterized protein n=1 Tax=Arundo donax TaxID=35708 RepID=A0A0A9AT34_ARUDO